MRVIGVSFNVLNAFSGFAIEQRKVALSCKIFRHLADVFY